ncbi:MAG: hypothetical protein IPH12_11865 [Saprospirales bacterium]|nr:hypothetical protein [Saprospirales bacterium]MBK8922071.1 hypothetical protein [Saprospirales bacterium]
MRLFTGTYGILLLASALPLVFSGACGKDCKVNKTRYEWTDMVQGEARRALIWTPSNSCIKAPVLIYLHGRGGTAEDSEMRRKFHDLMPEAYVIYAEGTNFDNRPDGTFGWEPRFPHISTVCQKNKDIDYILKLLAHLNRYDDINFERVGVCGHSSGGFFTLTLAALLPEKFRGFACLGAYASYNAAPSLIDCTDTYVDGIDQGNASTQNQGINPNPAPTFFILGKQENTIQPNAIVYNTDCTKFSYFQNSILQICLKNESVLPDCAQANFMNTLQRQVFPAKHNNAAETQVQIYDADHSWPDVANQWVTDYFKELLYH